MPTLGDAYMGALRRKSVEKAPGPIPEAAPAPTTPGVSAAPGGDLGALVSNEALDALNTIQVLKLASAGNPMAQDFVDKLEHHLRTIIKQAEGERHWPDKYRVYFKEEEAAPAIRAKSIRMASPVPGTPSGVVQRLASTRLGGSTHSAHGGGSGSGAEGEEGEERLGNLEFLGEEEDDDAEDLKEARRFRLPGMGGLGSPKASEKKDGSARGLKSDVDIYNIINAEEKDVGGAAGKRRKGLALGQAISHSMKTCLFSETAGSKSTKHPPAAFTQNRATDVTFQDVTFSFQEYAPVVFLSIREHFGIDNETYLKSMGELKGGQVGEGKSGMLFFSSADREFIVKTVTPNELKFLERELKSYYDYMVVNGATSLLPRFVGLYFLKLPDKPIVRLIVMNNVFKLPKGKNIELVEMYDLKGSLHTRYVGPEEQAMGKVSVLKDLNFCNRHEGTDSHGHPFTPIEGACRPIYLGPIRKIELLANLQSDVEWLRQHNIMDYSLLLAVGFEVTPDGVVPAPAPTPAPADGTAPSPASSAQAGAGATAATAAIPPEEAAAGAGAGAGAVVEASKWQSAWSMDLGGVRGMNGDFTERAEIYYMGVIDILQEYNAKKRAEHTFKSFTADSTKISAVDPNFYAERFLNWMQSHVL